VGRQPKNPSPDETQYLFKPICDSPAVLRGEDLATRLARATTDAEAVDLRKQLDEIRERQARVIAELEEVLAGRKAGLRENGIDPDADA
jgi:hypothetical protein